MLLWVVVDHSFSSPHRGYCVIMPRLFLHSTVGRHLGHFQCLQVLLLGTVQVISSGEHMCALESEFSNQKNLIAPLFQMLQRTLIVLKEKAFLLTTPSRV